MRTAMDCDLVEVSGQMDLPLPKHTPAYPFPDGASPALARWTTSHTPLSHRAARRRDARSPPDFQHRTPMDRAATGKVAGAGELPRRAVRRLEPKEYCPMTVRWKPLLILSGLFVVVALVGVIAITMTLVPRSSAGLPEAREGGPGGRPLRRCRDPLQAGTPDRRQERRDPRGVRRAVSRLGSAAPLPKNRRPCVPSGSARWSTRSISTRRSRALGSSSSRTRWPRTWRPTRSTGPRHS